MRCHRVTKSTEQTSIEEDIAIHTASAVVMPVANILWYGGYTNPEDEGWAGFNISLRKSTRLEEFVLTTDFTHIKTLFRILQYIQLRCKDDFHYIFTSYKGRGVSTVSSHHITYQQKYRLSPPLKDIFQSNPGYLGSRRSTEGSLWYARE